jgi:O-antigen/teichoic acid export membrane protein
MWQSQRMSDPTANGTTKTDTQVDSGSGIFRRLAHSFAVYSGANFGIRALNFLLIVVYAHYLHPSDYGIIYLADIVASFLIIFMGLSLDNALQRLYFQHSHSAAELDSYLGSVIRFGLALMAIMLAAVLLTGDMIQSKLPHLISISFFPYIALSVTTATATQGIQYLLAIYQSARRPQTYALLSFVLAALTAVCCVYGVIVRRGGALGMMEGKLAATGAVFLVAIWSMRKFLTAPFQRKFARDSLVFSLPLIPHLVMASGLVVADRLILEHYRDLNEVGIYSLSYTIGMVMFLVTQSLSQAWLPMFFQMAGEGEEKRHTLGRICSGLAVLLAAIACCGILLSPLFVQIALDSRYHAAMHIVPLVVMGYFFHALFSLFDLSILQANRTVSVFVISLVAFSLNLFLNFALIPRWGMVGAAWATTLAYAVEAIGAYILAQRFFALPYRLAEISAVVVIACGCLLFTQSTWASKWHGSILALAIFPALGLVALVGKRDFQKAFVAIGKARQPNFANE